MWPLGSNIYTSTALSKARSSVLIGIERNRTEIKQFYIFIHILEVLWWISTALVLVS